MERVVLASACRTPVAKLMGGFRDTTAVQLGVVALQEAMRRASVRPAEVEEVLLGHVLQAGVGQNPARQAALGAGCPPTVAAVTINKVCGSGLEAVMQAARAIKAGDVKLVLAGGMESMTNAPHLVHLRKGVRLGEAHLLDHMVHDGLTDGFCCMPMSTTGEDVAKRYHVQREQADQFALESHRKAHQATERGAFKDEVVVTPGMGPRGPAPIERDEGIRGDTTLERLGQLAPVIGGGIITAGNASQISDGAAALVVMAESEAKRRNVQPLAYLRAYNTVGVEPERIMEAPINGVRELLKRENLRIEDIDVVEHNEAFATASVVVRRELGIPESKFNVHGGAVALGHPLGASGARVLTTLLYAMQQRRAHRGLATLCLGGGNAVTAIVERPGA
ncbi:MAG: thiolase family protein [Halobacteriales archaeon]|nr:thiolase family protein [Halobacteriales archaeon]